MQKRNLRLLYAHEFFFSLADTLLPFIVPIFIYKTFHSLSAVFLWAFGWNFVYAFMYGPLLRWAARLKRPNWIMGIGILFYLITMGIFSNINAGNHWLIFLSIFTHAVFVAAYWPLRHWFISVNVHEEKVGGQVSLLWAARLLAGFLGPVIGGWLSFAFSFNSAFLFGSCAAVISAVPLMLIKAAHHPEVINSKNCADALKNPPYSLVKRTYFLEGISYYFVALGWVMAFYIFISNEKNLGALIGSATLIAAILSRIIGHFFDRKKRLRLLKSLTFTRVGAGFMYCLALIFPGLGSAMAAELTYRFAWVMHETTAMSYQYAYGLKTHPVLYILNREKELVKARSAGTLLLAIIFLFAPPEYLICVIAIGTLSALGWLYLSRLDHVLEKG
jgi:MFS family permease